MLALVTKTSTMPISHTTVSRLSMPAVSVAGEEWQNTSTTSIVTRSRLVFCASLKTSIHSARMVLDSSCIFFRSCLSLREVTDEEEWKEDEKEVLEYLKISSERSLRICILFSQRERDVRDESHSSAMKVGHWSGHSCLMTCKP